MVSSTPRPYFTHGKDPVSIVQEAGWDPGPVWTDGKSRPSGIRSPDRPARSSIAIPTELTGSRLKSYIAYLQEKKVIGKIVPVHATKAYRGRRGIAALSEHWY